jgi:membrane protein YqaA with SNARE-associated domain
MAVAGASSSFVFGLLRRLYEWVLGWAGRKSALWALWALAFAEASFFPIPPDVLLMTMAIGKPGRAFRFALVCSLGSVMGGALGYLLGYQFYALVGQPVIDFYAATDQYERVRELFETWNAVAVAVAGFTPIPFKVFTIAAGAFQVHFLTFMLAAAASRSARFFLVSGLIYYFGPAIREKIDRYFNQLTILFVMMLLGGFLLLKYVV